MSGPDLHYTPGRTRVEFGAGVVHSETGEWTLPPSDVEDGEETGGWDEKS